MLTGDDLKRAKARTMEFEGVRSKPYRDTAGNLTIGRGRNLDGKGLSDSEIQYLFENDWDDAEVPLWNEPWFQPLTPPRKAAIVDMAFNLGETGLDEFKRFIALLARGLWVEAAAQIRNSVYYAQRRNRAESNARLIETGEWS